MISEPCHISGEGQYNFNVMKEIQVTNSFLELDPKVTGCQKEESIHNCTTRNLIDTLKRQCGCLPFKMIHSEKVIELTL